MMYGRNVKPTFDWIALRDWRVARLASYSVGIIIRPLCRHRILDTFGGNLEHSTDNSRVSKYSLQHKRMSRTAVQYLSLLIESESLCVPSPHLLNIATQCKGDGKF